MEISGTNRRVKIRKLWIHITVIALWRWCSESHLPSFFPLIPYIFISWQGLNSLSWNQTFKSFQWPVLQHLSPLIALSETFSILDFHSSYPRPCFILLCCLALTSPLSSLQSLPASSSVLNDAAPTGLLVLALIPRLTWVQLLLNVGFLTSHSS